LNDSFLRRGGFPVVTLELVRHLDRGRCQDFYVIFYVSLNKDRRELKRIGVGFLLDKRSLPRVGFHTTWISELGEGLLGPGKLLAPFPSQPGFRNKLVPEVRYPTPTGKNDEAPTPANQRGRAI